jgi:hypothetical protein
MKVQVHEHESKRQCPFCHGALGAEEALHACSKCAATYHAECAREALRCGVLGCGADFMPVQRPCARCRKAMLLEDPTLQCHVCATESHAACAEEGAQCGARDCPGVLVVALTPSRRSSEGTDRTVVGVLQALGAVVCLACAVHFELESEFKTLCVLSSVVLLFLALVKLLPRIPQ